MAILAIAWMGAIFFRGTCQLIADAERLEHTHTIINTLGDFYTDVRDLRFAARSYAVSNDEQYLQHYRAATAHAQQDLITLNARGEVNAKHREKIAKLEQLMLQAVAQSEEVIKARKTGGLLRSLPVIRRQIESEVNDPIRELVKTLVAEKREQLLSRGLESQNSSRAMLVMIVAGSIAEILVAVATALAIRRYFKERQKAHGALTRTKEVLEAQSEQLELARQQADSANRAKSAFLANMSHEIRTPVTAILGYADLVLEPNQTQSDRHDSLQTIRRSAKHLLDLVNDILDLSKIEAGKMTVESIPCNPAQVVSEVISMVRPRAEEKRVQMRLEFDGPFPDRISSDPLRLRQVLTNLIGNAVKFTDEGLITVRARCTKSEEGAGRLQVRICDTGIGMTCDQLGNIFRPFTQADETTTRRFGGSGLGLSISKRLAAMLGGDIVVQSEPGKGSCFTLDVAAGNLNDAHWIHGLTESTFTTAHEKAGGDAAQLKGRILLAEDGKDNQRLITTHLVRAGAEVVIADNGRSAVDRVMSDSFDLVVMDMQMPELDGYGAAREIRDLGYTMPIIALTAHAMSGDREKCLRAGCTDYLTKPIDKYQFLWTVARHLDAIRREEPPRPSPSQHESVRSDFVNDAAMSELVTQFVEELPQQVAKLSEFLEEHRIDELRRLVHQLKGAGGGFGFAPITTEAAKAEHLIRSSAELSKVERAVRDLIALIRKVEGYQPSRETEPCLKKS
ncbi:MAG TPA: ATP-binding protein [Tepidisphaeraceae bacterium]